jgi:hypothetical protein
MLLHILFAYIPDLHAQKSLTESQRDSLIAERWDFKKLEKKYPLNGPKVFKIIEQCFPHEIDTLIAMGDTERTRRKWGKANLYYEIVLFADPDNLAANYGRGISKRESGRSAMPLIRIFVWRSAQKHFERVIAIDPTFKDVLYQFALLEYYRQKSFKAIALAQRQFAVNEPSHEARIDIFRFYDYMLNHTQAEEAEKWLKSRNTKYDAYYLGELNRRYGQIEKADSLFQSLMADPGGLPLQPVLLSLVRLYIQEKKYREAESVYWRAVDRVSDEVEADLLLEDFMYIVNENEYDFLKKKLSLTLLPRTMRTLWLQRDPMPAAPYNQRLIEHYRRIIVAENEFVYDGYRHPKYKPESSAEYRFPKWYYENRKFNDMGLIYIRFGEPHDKSVKSWIYQSEEDEDPMIFLFEIHPNAPPGYWVLVPIFSNQYEALDVAVWDSRYNRMVTPAHRIFDRIINNVKTVERAFTIDRHSWTKETEELEMYQSIVWFKQDRDKDILQLTYAIPLSGLTYKETVTDYASFESGVVIFDDRMTPLFKNRRDFRLIDSSDEHIYNDLFIDEFEVPLPVGRYNIAVHARTLDDAKVNGWRYGYTLPDSARDRLTCSSLKLAFNISPKTAESDSRHRDDLKIIPNPTNKFNRNDPVYVYYEVYNLTYNASGMTDYAVNFILRQTGKKKGIVKRITGIFGSGEKYQVSVESEQIGNSITAADYISFDMSRAKAGEYELILEVKDKVSGVEAMVKSEIILE